MSGIRTEDAKYGDGDEDDSGQRTIWAILSWVAVALTIILNLVLILIVVVRKNFSTLVNKVILLVAAADLLYGILVAPFFVENYIWLEWNQSQVYCHIFVYFFTFHDLFAPLLLILLSAYVSVKYSGAIDSVGPKRPVYFACLLLAFLLPLLLAIPATVGSGLAMDNREDILECRTSDRYTMIVTYLVSSSVLFCFAMSFLFSLCIVGSPFLRATIDREEYLQRWRLLLTLSLVNGLYIVTGFLINFKEISRLFYDCCMIFEPFNGVNTVTYDVWSFVFLLLEQVLRPLAYLCFYLKFLLNDYSAPIH